MRAWLGTLDEYLENKLNTHITKLKNNGKDKEE